MSVARFRSARRHQKGWNRAGTHVRATRARQRRRPTWQHKSSWTTPVIPATNSIRGTARHWWRPSAASGSSPGRASPPRRGSPTARARSCAASTRPPRKRSLSRGSGAASSMTPKSPPSGELMSWLAISLSIAVFLLGVCRDLIRTGRPPRLRHDPVLRPVAAFWRHHGHMHRRHGAQLRAMALLQDWLSPVQREQYARERHFDVIGSASGRRYRIHHGIQFNIEELDADGCGVAALCFAPEGPLPVGDVMLAQKIALETNEMAAVAVANRIGPPPAWRAC